MALDAHRLAQFAATTLEQLERDEHLPARDAELVDAQLIVEITGSTEDGDPVSLVKGFTMNDSNISGVNLLMRALATAMQSTDD